MDLVTHRHLCLDLATLPRSCRSKFFTAGSKFCDFDSEKNPNRVPWKRAFNICCFGTMAHLSPQLVFRAVRKIGGQIVFHVTPCYDTKFGGYLLTCADVKSETL